MALGKTMAMSCPGLRQSIKGFLTRTEVTGGFSVSCSAFAYKLQEWKIRLPVVKRAVGSAPKPGCCQNSKGDCREQQKIMWLRPEGFRRSHEFMQERCTWSSWWYLSSGYAKETGGAPA